MKVWCLRNGELWVSSKAKNALSSKSNRVKYRTLESAKRAKEYFGRRGLDVSIVRVKLKPDVYGHDTLLADDSDIAMYEEHDLQPF